MKKLFTVILALALVVGASLSCTAAGENTASVGTDINIAVLSGPTGIGAVGLMEANDAGSTVNRYSFTVAAANDSIVAGIASGSFDIAAAATNVAANLYNKTSGGVQICALNTLGVLYILENGNDINTVADLKGKTVYAVGQGANPEYILKYITAANGLSAVFPSDGDVSTEADFNVEFLSSEELVAGAVKGSYSVVMLPVPAVTSVLLQNKDMRAALDLTAEWNTAAESGELAMGCIIVRTEFAKENPEAVKAFLEEYEASIQSVLADPAHAGELCETYGIVPKAAIAAKAIPDCNLCFISGENIRSTVEPYYNVLFGFNPAAVGGAVPAEDFYFVG